MSDLPDPVLLADGRVLVVTQDGAAQHVGPDDGDYGYWLQRAQPRRRHRPRIATIIAAAALLAAIALVVLWRTGVVFSHQDARYVCAPGAATCICVQGGSQCACRHEGPQTCARGLEVPYELRAEAREQRQSRCEEGITCSAVEAAEAQEEY